MATMQSRRRSLLTIVIAGSIVTALVGAGVFAVFSDRATTGANALESPEMAAAVDLELASVEADGTCGDFADDLETGLFTVSDNPSFGVISRVCLRNAGSEETPVALSTLDLVDVDFACSGTEAAADPTCGADQVGELSSALQVVTAATDAAYPCPAVDATEMAFLPDAQPTIAGTLDGMVDNTNVSVGSLNSGEALCFFIGLTYAPLAPTQTDRVTWRFAFDAVPPQTPSCVDDELDPGGTIVTSSGTFEGVICPGMFDQFSIDVQNGGSATVDLSYVNANGDLDLYTIACTVDFSVCEEPAVSDSDTSDSEGVIYTNTTGEPRNLFVAVIGHDHLHNLEPLTITNSYSLTIQL
jgi:hypothetical protein